ncbi:MAG: aminodeoxychorismate/anthranilate synthase component II [Candidatus Omnitrophica bacterium]|nr:aminodeoxychorismate/anthranilate synthase component II [Candidatus Omnitrophota bacterium]
MKKQKIVMIDNYDSFTYNLVQYLGEMGQELVVLRNDQATVKEVAALHPDRIVISPGPGSPKDAGISCDVIRAFAGKVPVLGVCLGHQCIGEVYGGKVVRNYRLMHGKTSEIHHDSTGVFKGLPNPFEATRYHSLVVRLEDFPKELKVTAYAEKKEVMGLQHRKLPVYGVQFHPESILTHSGKQLLKNFLSL